jgi:hypothetical protein
MTQADSVHSTPPTNTSSETKHAAPTGLARRAFVTALAGGAAAAIVAPAAALAAANPDAEIIAAGKAFEPLLSKYLDAQFIWMKLSREARDATDAKYPSDYWDGPGEHPK